jgi:MoaA/NifB/PqqE/SkfB family radical SAM enzyme
MHRRGLTENIDSAIRRYAFVPLHRKTAACYAGWFHARVRVDGTIVPCGAVDIVTGHMASQAFDEIWNGQEYRRFRRCMRTYEGMRELSMDEDNCKYCCYAWDNQRIGRCVGGWLERWLRISGRPSESLKQPLRFS